MPKITFENGVTVNVQGNPTQEDIDEIAQKVGVTKSKQQPAAPAQEEPGGVKGAFKRGWKGLVEDIDHRIGKTEQIKHSDQSLGSKTLQILGQGFGSIGDALGASIGTTASALTPDGTEKKIKRKMGETVNRAMQTDLVKKVQKDYGEFKKENPETAGNLEALANIADAFSNALGGGAAVKGGRAAVRGGKAAAKGAVELGEQGVKAGVRGTAKGASKLSKPIFTGAKKVTGVANEDLAKTGTSWMTGLEKDTVDQILKHPDRFSKKAMEKTSREQVFGKVQEALTKRKEELNETGRAYDTIRQSGQQIDLPDNFIEESLSKLGFKIDDGKITTTTKSATREKADINALQQFYNNWRGKKTIDTDEFLNMRSDLANLAKYDRMSGKTSGSEKIAKKLRAELNEQARKVIPGLEELDREFSRERTILGKLGKDLYNRDGTLKDNALTKIANLTNKGKEQLAKRIEELVPGVSKEVNILKAIEDIERAKGIKVGTYLRGATGGFLASGGNPIVTILSAIGTSPQVAVPALRKISQIKKGGGFKYMVQELKKRKIPNKKNE